MAPCTPEEVAWITGLWLTSAQRRTSELCAAVLLPHGVFARLTGSQLRNEAKAASVTSWLFDTDEAATAWLRAWA
jgi:hypothetical protein